MGWQLTEDVDRYARAVGGLLGRDPAAHTIGLTVVEQARLRPLAAPVAEVYGWYTETDGTVTGAVSLTPPHPLLVECAPGHSLRGLVEMTTEPPGPLSGVSGVNAVAGTAAEVSALWTAATGGRAWLGWAQRLFVLEQLVVPDPGPPGRARPATDADRSLVAAWGLGFARDAGIESEETVVRSVLGRLETGGLTLWCVDGPGPVAMAGRTVPAAGAVRIGPVYTPPAHRNHGYGAAVTAAATAEALGQAATVVLFTDLANPTSNALYPRLGYRPVADRTVFRFVRPGEQV